jgi:hypothetical protein
VYFNLIRWQPRAITAVYGLICRLQMFRKQSRFKKRCRQTILPKFFLDAQKLSAIKRQLYCQCFVFFHLCKNATPLIYCYQVIRLKSQKLVKSSQRLCKSFQFEEGYSTDVKQVNIPRMGSKCFIANLDHRQPSCSRDEARRIGVGSAELLFNKNSAARA